MFVNVIANRRDPENRLAFIKFKSKKFGDISLPGYFDKSFIAPSIGEHEVMICGVLMKRGDRTITGFGGTPHEMVNAILWDEPPKCVFIRTPTLEDMKVFYDGFECSGSMCATTTRGTEFYGGKVFGTITPGKMMDYLVTAQNVNRRGDDREARTPGIGWAKMADTGHMRLEGVDSMDCLIF